MYLIQILLPLYDNNGEAFGHSTYNLIRKQLTESFGGVTIYNRAPATGIWKENDKHVRDEIIIFEIMSEELNLTYWNACKLQLQEIFKQDVIIIRAIKIDLL
jgi:hypothetical protein